ncbi:MAG: mercuric reductase [Planctomycetota bacterium]
MGIMLEHDERLRAHVHPADWPPPEPARRYHMVVIGGGTAGLVTALGAAGLGARVALVERAQLGGDCLNTGCVPSKALLASARVAEGARRAAAFGVTTGDVAVNFPHVMERMRRLRADIAEHDSAERLRSHGVDVFLGDATFKGRKVVVVGAHELRFHRACVATGSRPRLPPIDGLDPKHVLTNESVFDLNELPRRLAVLGGGPVGCELAQAFAAFGSEVTLIQRGERVLQHDDAEAAAVVQRSLRNSHVRLRLATTATKLARGADGAHVLSLAPDDFGATLEADRVLVATGRSPVVDGLELEQAGVEYDAESGIRVDDNLRTTNERIFAAGDVCLSTRFTHAADAAARIVVRNALFPGSQKWDAERVPWCTYTDPELAHVGQTEDRARRNGRGVEVIRIESHQLDRAVVDGRTDGFVKFVVDRRTQLVGATIVGAHAGERLAELVPLVTERVALHRLAGRIHPYPTYAAATARAGDRANAARLTPFRAKLARVLLAFLR